MKYEPMKSKMMRLRMACNEIIEREREDLSDMADPNCYGAGWSSGAINAAEEIIACLAEEEAESNVR